MQVKEYKSPEEALKEVKDPIIRSAIEPLSDKVAEMEKVVTKGKKKNNKVEDEKEDSVSKLNKALEFSRQLETSKELEFKANNRYINSASDVSIILSFYIHEMYVIHDNIPNSVSDEEKIESKKALHFNCDLKGIDTLKKRVSEYKKLNLNNVVPKFECLCDFYKILEMAKEEVHIILDTYLPNEVLFESVFRNLYTLQEIADHYKAEEHEGKQD